MLRVHPDTEVIQRDFRCQACLKPDEVMPALAAAERGDVFITVTGARDVLGPAHFERMKDGAVLANAGHFDVEIDVLGLGAAASAHREVRPLVEQYVLHLRDVVTLDRPLVQVSVGAHRHA